MGLITEPDDEPTEANVAQRAGRRLGAGGPAAWPAEGR